MLVVEDIWKQEFESGNYTLDQIIEYFLSQELAHETLSWYILFFGKGGLLSRPWN